MLIASRNSFAVPPRPTAKSYVQDGLIYHLDAAENIGYGQFSDSTLIWYNLVGGNDASIPSLTPLSWSKFGCDFKGRTYNQSISIPIGAFPSTVRTVEWCGSFTNNTDYIRYICDATSNSNTGTYTFGLGTTGLANQSGYVNAMLGDGKLPQQQINSSLPYPTLGTKFTSCVRFTTISDIYLFLNGVGTNQFSYNNITRFPTFNVAMCMPNKSSSRTCDIVCCGLRVYNRALTASEIAANYAVDKTRFNLP